MDRKMKENIFRIRRRMRRICLCVLILLCLTGCGSVGEKARVLQGRMEIPEDGIISKDIFRQLQEENGVITFTGISNDVAYEWTVFGSDLEACKDCNLAISVEKKDAQKIVFEHLSEENYGFPAVLSIYLNELWNAESAVVAQLNGTEETAVCTASITGSENSILNFPVESSVGKYVITPLSPAYASDEEIISTGEKEAEASKQEDAEKNSTNGSSAKDKQKEIETDSYLSSIENTTKEIVSSAESTGNRTVSDGKKVVQDEYLTDPIPEGKPMPVEPDEQQVDKEKEYTCTFSIECSSILNHLEDLAEGKLDEVPSGGTILKAQTVTFHEGESVYDVLQRVCRENGIQMEASWTPIYNSAYVEGIHNLYEFDCGSGSGWMYRVNGWYPNYGCSRYQLEPGEVVEWRYTCNLGKDIGGSNALGN